MTGLGAVAGFLLGFVDTGAELATVRFAVSAFNISTYASGRYPQ